MFTGTQRDAPNGIPWFAFTTKADRRVSCYYFYLWDAEFGPAFIKLCAYFPYPAKIRVTGHEWAKRQALRAGIGSRELSNGFAATDDPGRAAGHPRPARSGHHRGVRRALVRPGPAAGRFVLITGVPEGPNSSVPGWCPWRRAGFEPRPAGRARCPRRVVAND